MTDSAPPIAHVLRTPRLCLRAYHPDDAAAVAEAVNDDLNHLRPWMPFAQCPLELDATIRLFETFQERFEANDYAFSIWRADGELVGGCGLHPAVGPLGREAGYWIRSAHTRRGYATEALAALCDLAFGQEEVDRVELRIDPANHGSAALAERAGFVFEALLRRRSPFPDEPPRDVNVFTLFAHEWPRSPIAAIPVQRGTSPHE